MAKFVNASGGDVYHYFPEGHGDSVMVAAGQVIDVGDLEVEELDDCYLVGSGDDARAWPKSRWERQGEKSNRSKASDKSDSKSDKPEPKPAPEKSETPAE